MVIPDFAERARVILHVATVGGDTVYAAGVLFCVLRGGVGLEYDLVLLGLHCFLRLAHALYCHSG